MALRPDETIVAVASAPGGALRGIVRLSGEEVVDCLTRCFRPDQAGDPLKGRRARVIPGTMQLEPPLGRVPCDVYLWPGRRSYTRQPCAEIHTIGSPPLLNAVVRALCAAGARLAEPGEFTMRAFLAGRLDLTQAEAVLGVIDARSRTELDVALAQLAGGLRAPLSRLRDELLDLLAQLEAGLDFAEEDIELIPSSRVVAQLEQASGALGRLADQMDRRGEPGEAARVVLAGWRNVGKSSLLNALAEDAAAVVSEVAGTTRDYVVRRLQIDGLPCLLIDTAGIVPDRQTDRVAQAAQAMTTQQLAQAHLLLFCLDWSRPLNRWERRELSRTPSADRLIVLTKSDKPRATDFAGSAIETSSKTGRGLSQLRGEIARTIRASAACPGGIIAATAARCRESLRLAALGLDRAHRLALDRLGEELVAVELRSALDELGKVVGAVYTDDVLDRVFSRFCIGK